jgi:hypothetical protein
VTRTKTSGTGVKVKQDVCEDFRQARTAIGKVTTDLERLRKHAASLVKRTPRPAK